MLELPAFVPSSAGWWVEWSDGYEHCSLFDELLDAIRPAAPLLEAADRTIRQLDSVSRGGGGMDGVSRGGGGIELGPHGYNALHLRCEADWVMHTQRAGGTNGADKGIGDGASEKQQQLIGRLAAAEVRGAVVALQKHGVSTISPLFVAGGVRCDHHWLEPIRAAGYNTHCLPPTPTPAPGAREALPSYHGAVVDQWVASQAHHFIGRRGSSFSWLVGGLRRRAAQRRVLAHEKDGANDGATGPSSLGDDYAVPRELASMELGWYDAVPPSPLDRQEGGFRDFDANFGFPPTCSPL
jgi:hypothetical protein